MLHGLHQPSYSERRNSQNSGKAIAVNIVRFEPMWRCAILEALTLAVSHHYRRRVYYSPSAFSYRALSRIFHVLCVVCLHLKVAAFRVVVQFCVRFSPVPAPALSVRYHSLISSQPLVASEQELRPCYAPFGGQQLVFSNKFCR